MTTWNASDVARHPFEFFRGKMKDSVGSNVTNARPRASSPAAPRRAAVPPPRRPGGRRTPPAASRAAAARSRPPRPTATRSRAPLSAATARRPSRFRPNRNPR
eukprot:8694-Pelagococcus_subviridis.AAC.10